MSMLNRLVLVAGIALSFVAHSASLQSQQGGQYIPLFRHDISG